MREALLRQREGEHDRRPKKWKCVVFVAVAGICCLAVPNAWPGSSFLPNLARQRIEHAPQFIGPWTKRERAPGDQMHELVLIVNQRNQDVLEQMVHDMSNPHSPSFRKWLTRQQVEELTSNHDSMSFLIGSLRDLGASVVRETAGHFIRASASVATWEDLLNAELYTYRHTSLNHARARADSFTLPTHWHGHVDGILGMLDLDHFQHTARLSNDSSITPLELVANPFPGFVTPAVIREAYNMPNADVPDPAMREGATTQAVFSSLSQYYSPRDRYEFTKIFNLPNQPVQELSANGGYDYEGADASDAQCRKDTKSCTEANLDVQYMLAMSPWSGMGLFYQPSSKNLFVEMVESLASMTNPPHVMSISYGMPEVGKSDSALRAFNGVASKLAAQGVTLLASSGDDGANSLAPFINGLSCSSVLEQYGLTVSWPASSQWVTAVGATMGIESGSPEIACSTDATGPTAKKSAFPASITSGGGYSKKIEKPFWQDGVLDERQKMRGIPDVSLAGHAYVIRNGGHWLPVDGTSASAPAFAGMITILNAHLNFRYRRLGGDSQADTESSQVGQEKTSSSTCNADTGGTCTFFDCKLSRGPTECVRTGMFSRKCMCPKGYCANNGICQPEGTCAADTGGTCLVLPCKKKRGPVQCVQYGTFTYKCICPVGYCSIDGVCHRTENPDKKRSVGWLNSLLYRSKDSFKDITEGSNKCASKGRPCCGGFDATKGWDPVTGLGVVDFPKLAAALHVNL